MNRKLLEYLACPDCRSDLKVDRDEDEIESGTLTCTGCGHTFAIEHGIPRFVKSTRLEAAEQQTQEHFTTEFTALSEGDSDLESLEMDRYHFIARTGIDPSIYERFGTDTARTELPPGFDDYTPDLSMIAGKVVLDAGCGPGRFTRVVAPDAALTVGLDLGEHVDRAAQRCAHLDSVEFVQGSVLAPPFKPGIFDFVFSIGVLHHTPDPPLGTRELARLTKPGGRISIWVYPPEYWNGPIRGPFARTVHRLLARMPVAKRLWVCSRVLYPLGKAQAFLARRRWTKLVFAPLFLVPVPRHPQKNVMIGTIFDYYGPSLISTHTFEEVASWLRSEGITHVEPKPVPTSVLATR